jgi:putative PIN family toxin of toxin-antitoxin system
VRVKVDTSVWVAAVLSQSGAAWQVYLAFADGRFVLITSAPALAETEEVLQRPRLVRSGDARLRAREMIEAIRADAERVDVAGDLQVCRDPKDDIVIETALRGEADLLVTLDKDLLEDPNVLAALAAAGVRVLTPGQFLAALREATADTEDDVP